MNATAMPSPDPREQASPAIAEFSASGVFRPAEGEQVPADALEAATRAHSLELRAIGEPQPEQYLAGTLERARARLSVRGLRGFAADVLRRGTPVNQARDVLAGAARILDANIDVEHILDRAAGQVARELRNRGC